jgi:hypothetical protein
MHRNLTKLLLTVTCALTASVTIAGTELSESTDFSLHQVSHNIRANVPIASFLAHLTAPTTGKLRQLANTDPVTPATKFIAASETTVQEAARTGVIWVAPTDFAYFRYPLTTNPLAKFVQIEWSPKLVLNSCLLISHVQPNPLDFLSYDSISADWVKANTTNDDFNTLLTSIHSAATKPGASYKEDTLPVLAGGFAVRITAFDALITNKLYYVTCYFTHKT